MAKLTAALRRLLGQPQVAQRTVRELQSRASGASMRGRIGARYRGQAADVSMDASRRHATEESSEGSEERTKMDGLLSASVLTRGVLTAAQDAMGDKPTLIVLDDFYHVPFDDQPDVLAYLHQVVKNIDIFLKICGVRHRLQPFVEGNPPRGMQVGQDAAEISLDITLERFQAAQTFLEQVLTGICEPLGISIDALLTDGGRQRLVLGSGGVARDYLHLTQNALRNANERPSNPSRPHNRITAEDVNEAAAGLSALKQQDLARDAGPNADAVRQRLSAPSRNSLKPAGRHRRLCDTLTRKQQRLPTRGRATYRCAVRMEGISEGPSACSGAGAPRSALSSARAGLGGYDPWSRVDARDPPAGTAGDRARRCCCRRAAWS